MGPKATGVAIQEEGDPIWFKDTASGLTFVGTGAFLDVLDLDEIFKVSTVSRVPATTIKLETGVCVNFEHCNHPHKFHVERFEEIGKLYKLFIDNRATIEMTPLYFDELVKMKRRDWEASWDRSPDRMGGH